MNCCTISEHDSLSIVVFAGILEIKFLELRLEQLFVRQFGLVLSDQSWGEAAAERVFDYLIVLLAHSKTPIEGCSCSLRTSRSSSSK